MTGGPLFATPLALVLLGAVPALWWLQRRHARRRQHRLSRALGAGAPAPTQTADRLRRAAFAAALGCAVLALARPQWGAGDGAALPRRADVLLCLDVSRSMLAADVRPSRLAAAKRAIGVLAERAAGSRLGLVAFAGEARTVIPLTDDLDAFAQLLELVDPRSLRRGGTDLGTALQTAAGALTAAAADGACIVLITDGEDHGESGRRAAAACHAQAIVVHCAGIGSERGAKIAVDDAGGVRFLTDASGAEVISSFEREGLQALATAGGGRLVALGGDDDGLATLFATEILPRGRPVEPTARPGAAGERFQWPLLAAFLLWIVELCLARRT